LTRWSLPFALPLALLVALGASELADRLHRWRNVALGALLMAMVVELNVFPLPWSSLRPTPPVSPGLTTQPEDFALLELPMAPEGVDA
jgi:hypothetical protein